MMLLTFESVINDTKSGWTAKSADTFLRCHSNRLEQVKWNLGATAGFALTSVGFYWQSKMLALFLFIFSEGVSFRSSAPEGVECLEYRSLTQQGQITISLQDRDGLLQSLAVRFY